MKKSRRIFEKGTEGILRLSSVVTIAAVAFIALFILSKGIQPFLPGNREGTYSFIDFITGLEWRPNDDVSVAKYGILYMIVGSVLGTGGAILIGLPISIFSAAYIAELAPNWIRKTIQSGVLLLAGIPSVIYGVFGLGFVVPMVDRISPEGRGESLLAVIIVLTMMILPTMIAITENAIRSVPKEYRTASYALGASKVYTTMYVTVPAAKRGILVGVILGIGRAIGEAMAVILVAGNNIAGLPNSLFSQVRPLTTNVVLEMSYASGLHAEILFSTGAILMLFIIVINYIMSKITNKMGNY